MLILPSPFTVMLTDPLDAAATGLLILYTISLTILLLSAGQSALLLALQLRPGQTGKTQRPLGTTPPVVTIQVPVYNELHVVERCIRAVCNVTYPSDRLQIQILDDSTDETQDMIRDLVVEFRSSGLDIQHVRRSGRTGFKAGALRNGLTSARGEFIAIFDADFVPRPSFLLNTIPLFSDPSVAMVQSRWEYLNETFSSLTRVQAFAFDAHFGMEQRIRSGSGQFLTFNGTGGIWRTEAILDAGGWHDDTLTEDLDLSYRAQLRGWKLVYRNEVTSPSELPVDFNAFRMQQYRWTRGYIQTARKILPILWRSCVPLGTKLVSTLHLTSHLAFPFVVVIALLNVPVAVLQSKSQVSGIVPWLPVFGLGLLSTFIYFVQSQRTLHTHWLKRLLMFPVFLAGSMGLAVSNAVAVFQGLTGSRGHFIRTPKFGAHTDTDTWNRKRYAFDRAHGFVLAEIPLALYCFFGVVFSLYQLNFLAAPLHLLFAAGFALVAGMSVKHAQMVRRTRSDRIS